MKFNIVTLFPEIIDSYFSYGVCAQAIKKDLLEINTIQLRDFAFDKHQTVDDAVYGGGDGMLLMYEPLAKAMASVGKESFTVNMSPRGKQWSDALALEWSKIPSEITVICGRYAGVDQRFINEFVDEEISIGDYVISGGELSAAVLVDSIARKIKGVLGNEISPEKDSFSDKLLEGPSFTRPQEINAALVPSVFTRGNHANIKMVEEALSVLVTYKNREELITDKEKVLESVRIIKRFLSKKEIEVCGLPYIWFMELETV